MRARYMMTGVAVAAAVAGCEPRSDPDAATPGQAPFSGDRPQSIRQAISIEGMQDTLTFHLVQAPGGFTLHFTTYVPEDMETEFSEEVEGGVVHFRAAFGGVRTERARLTVQIHPEGTIVEQAQQQLAAYLSGLYPDDTPVQRDAQYEAAVPVEPADRYPWARDESRFRVPAEMPNMILVGRAGLGTHGERVFHYIIEYPQEFAEGMEPRVQVILDEWRWTDTGGGLGSR